MYSKSKVKEKEIVLLVIQLLIKMYSRTELKGIRIIVREAQEMGLKMLEVISKRKENC